LTSLYCRGSPAQTIKVIEAAGPNLPALRLEERRFMGSLKNTMRVSVEDQEKSY